MPPTAASLRVGRYFLSLLLILGVLFGLVFLPGQRHTPKLGLDLEGGKQIVLLAKKPGGGTPSKQSMTVAREILGQRVNGKGVGASEIVQQGADKIDISIPGKNTKDLAGIETTAQLNFRPLVMPSVYRTVATAPAPPSGSPPTTAPKVSGSPVTSPASPTGSPATSGAPVTSGATASGNGLLAPAAAAPASTTTKPAPSAKPVQPASTAATASTGAAPPASPSTTAAPSEVQNPFAGLPFALPKTETEYAALPATQQQQLTAALSRFKCGSKPLDDPTKPLAACNGVQKFLLGPVIIKGTDIKTASAQAPGGSVTNWTVSLSLKDAGDSVWANYTKNHHSDTGSSIPSNTICSVSTTPCAEYVAFTLDGDVVSDPHNEATIAGTPTSISGGFDQKSANELANLLKYGALPLNLTVLTNQDVSATLGSSQLQAGLLAGGIGLLLVVFYSLLYYRGLGLVTIASLLVSGGLTYGCLVVLGREIGFTLTLAGIAGFIVAVGITADSFVVFFERLKDEVHSGRSIRVAVPRAWTRARRTILSADTVSFLAAAVLYYFAAGDVRGFAFTLGLSTVLDLVVVFLFTHPLISLLARSRTFGSPRFTGLNSVRAGGIVDTVPTRPARAQQATRLPKPKSGSTAVALLEPGTDDDLDVDDGLSEAADAIDEAPVAAAPTLRTSKPPVVSGDAAQRAAARRGRRVRPPTPVVTEDDDDAAAPEPTEPGPTEAVLAEPVAARPVVAEHVAAEPVAAQPVVAEQVAAEPIAADPVAAEPETVKAHADGPADTNMAAAQPTPGPVQGEPVTSSAERAAEVDDKESEGSGASKIDVARHGLGKLEEAVGAPAKGLFSKLRSATTELGKLRPGKDALTDGAPAPFDTAGIEAESATDGSAAATPSIKAGHYAADTPAVDDPPTSPDSAVRAAGERTAPRSAGKPAEFHEASSPAAQRAAARRARIRSRAGEPTGATTQGEDQP